MKTLDFETELDGLLKDPETHAKFVNTISLLEYLGARKILKSQNSNIVTAELLAHAAEEIRHAQILKNFALKLSDGRLVAYEPQHLFRGTEARDYFRAVDEIAADALKTRGQRRNYLVTTLLVEERATEFYPLYAKRLQKHGVRHPLDAIIIDEDAHLAAIRNELMEDKDISDGFLNELRVFEGEKFRAFLR